MVQSDAKFLKKHKNRFFETIKDYGLDPQDFMTSEEELDNHIFFTLQYKDTPLKFIAFRQTNNFNQFRYVYIRYTPDFKRYTPINIDSEINVYYEPNTIFSVFLAWLKTDVREFIEEQSLPDLWEHVHYSRDLFPDLSSLKDDDVPFTETEKAEVKRALQTFRERIFIELKLEATDMELLDQHLNYLTQAVDRNNNNKRDWLFLALGTLITIITNLTLDVESGRTIFRIFKEVFFDVLKLLP